MKFSDARQRMIKYLQSEDFTSREDAQTTNTDNLIQINKKGFLTENSQEGILHSGFNKDTQKYFLIKERAYVTGFMKNSEVEEFVNRINNTTDKVAFSIIPSVKEESSFITVTVSASAESKAKLKTTPLTPATKLFTSLPDEVLKSIKKSVHINQTEAVSLVAVFDPVYGRKATSVKGVFKDILNHL